jgi:hypothetical protein
VPDKSYTINVRVAVKPSRTSTTVDDVLLENWVDAVVDGALMRLYSMPERFGNGKLAQFHGARFQQAINKAHIESTVGRTRSDLRIRPVRI